MLNKDQFKRNLGKIVKKYRNKRGYTQTKLAELTGFCKSYICQIEKSQVLPNCYMLYVLMKTLNIPSNLIYNTSVNHAIKDTQSKELLSKINTSNIDINIIESFVDSVSLTV